MTIREEKPYTPANLRYQRKGKILRQQFRFDGNEVSVIVQDKVKHFHTGFPPIGRFMKLQWSRLLSSIRLRKLCEGKEGSSSDHRSEFDRDYDRSIFCTPLRRLHDKAQVFPLEPDDYVRTRLTHSLEVSTVARDVGRAIARWLLVEKKEIDDTKQATAIETIAATCGLIHDLGNPPFGHAGESAIRSWFKNQDKHFWKDIAEDTQCAQDFLRYEGNAQTIRLITKLQILADFYGLNLTCGTLSAACKYIARSNEMVDKKTGPHEFSKVGFFLSEEELIFKVAKEVGLVTPDGKIVRNPIAFIVEACDDIVYSVVDLEDGVKKGVLSWRDIEDQLKDKAGNCIEDARRILGDHELLGSEYDRAMTVAFRVTAISAAVNALIEAFKNHYDEIIHGSYHKEILKDSSEWELIDACKTVGRNYVYGCTQNALLETMGRRVLHDLLDLFWEGVQEGGQNGSNRTAKKIYSLLSDNYRRVFERERKSSKYPESYCEMLLVTDFVCGMTDTYACNLHKRLFNG